MQKAQYAIVIYAPREKVWQTLWDDSAFREWASIIDEGTYMTGGLVEGSEVQFISSVNGYGVTSLVEKLIPNEHISFRHSADTKEVGAQKREKEWTGGTESYSLQESNGITTVTVNMDIPEEQRQVFDERVPQALSQVKFLAER